MVFYFSATGNSLWVARRLADTFGISLRSVVSRQERKSLLSVFSDKEPLFLVFPVHSWGPAVPMSDFIDRLVVDDYAGQPIYIVCVCGDDCGRTDKIVDKMLRRKGLQLTSVFSVQMPNNYILLPGFDVDAPSVAAEKLNAASARIQAIVEAVRSGCTSLLVRFGKVSEVEKSRISVVQEIRSLGKFVSCNRCLYGMWKMYPHMPYKNDFGRSGRSSSMEKERVCSMLGLHTPLS